MKIIELDFKIQVTFRVFTGNEKFKDQVITSFLQTARSVSS